MWKDFKAFMLKQNALALAIAVVIGTALNKVVTAIVDDFIMPFVGVVTPSGEWQKAVLSLGSVDLKVGDFLSVLLNFCIIGVVVWRLSKLVPAPPSPETKNCPYCFNAIDPRSTRCQYCTATLSDR